METVYERGRIKNGVIYLGSGRNWFCKKGKKPSNVEFEAIIKYRCSNGEATVMSIDNGTEKTLEIPAEYNGDPVTELNSSMLDLCKNLERIKLPTTVKKINGAFSSCGTAVDFGANSTITEISNGAFRFYYGDTVVLPESVETIGKDAFYNSKITSIVIPENVTKIDESAFYGCDNLKSVTFKNTYGWKKISKYGGDTVAMNVTNPSANATALVDSFSSYWERS